MRRPGTLDQRASPDDIATAEIADRRAGLPVVAARWRPAAAALVLASLIFGVVFRYDFGAAVRVWIGSTAYNHCFLILPLIGFLLWERRAVFSQVAPSPTFWPLMSIPLLSGVWLTAAVLDLNEGRQLAVVAMFQIVLLAVLGLRAARLLLAPILFLFFLVPTGAFLVPTLQTITADIAVHGLHLLHIPVFSDGMMIEIPEGKFEIAEACAGLRFLIASVVFGCFFAVVMYRSYWRRAVFITLAVTVPVAANGLRALGIVALAHIEGSATAVEADHVLYGWIFFSLVTLLLIAIGMAFVDKAAPARRLTALVGEVSGSPWRLAAVAIAAVVLALTAPAYAWRLNQQSEASNLSLAAMPQIKPPWRSVGEGGVDWRPMIHRADRELFESFKDPGSALVSRYIALYRLRAVGNALTNSENRVADDHLWQITRGGRAAVSIADHRTVVTSTEIVSGPSRRLVWSFYLVDGHIVAGLLEAKLLQARAVLLHHAPVAAFVAVSASADNPDDPAGRQLERFLRANQPVLQFLNVLTLGRDAPTLGNVAGESGRVSR